MLSNLYTLRYKLHKIVSRSQFFRATIFHDVGVEAHKNEIKTLKNRPFRVVNYTLSVTIISLNIAGATQWIYCKSLIFPLSARIVRAFRRSDYSLNH